MLLKNQKKNPKTKKQVGLLPGRMKRDYFICTKDQNLQACSFGGSK